MSPSRTGSPMPGAPVKICSTVSSVAQFGHGAVVGFLRSAMGNCCSQTASQDEHSLLVLCSFAAVADCRETDFKEPTVLSETAAVILSS